METKIDIDSITCIKCGKCVKVCPSKIFDHQTDDKAIAVSNIAACIICGHCVAACPTSSIKHSHFTENKVHKIDYGKMPTPEQVLLLCKVRRSNRAFSKKAIPESMIDLILEAAHRAPTASNMQEVEFTVVTNPEKLTFISDFTVGVFMKILKKLENPFLKPLLKVLMPSIFRYVPTFKRLMKERERGNDMILRGATAVIFIHTHKEARYGKEDANLAYQNGSLMAESLEVSQFYTGFVCNAIKQDKNNRLAKKLGIKGVIHAGMALGMPLFKMENYIDKKEITVTKI